MGLSVIEWKDIEGCPGYLISNEGIVKNPKGRLLYGSDKDGYIRTFVGYKPMRAHRLVALAFVKNPNNYNEVNHIDGNKKNNHASNLEWCSRSHNTKHSFEIGLNKARRGAESAKSKLTQDQVDYVRNNYIPRHPVFGQSAIARSLGVHNSTLSLICRGVTY
jgi:hypothetical protein